ncbi:hypothetical protein SVIOM74S_05929 [Streptomyces violarus]
MAAQGEEVVVDADRRHGQYLGEQVTQGLLLGGVGGPAAAGGGGEVRLGEGAAVELAVRGQRQGIEHREHGRHHVDGHALPEEGPQLGRIDPGAGDGYDVGGQAGLSPVVVAGEDGRVGDPGVRGEDGLELAGFDAVAADLDLVVRPPGEDELSVAAPSGQVAGAVHPRPRRAVRIGDEPLGRHARAAQITARQSGTGHVQFAGHPGRYQPQRRVQDVRAGAGDRPAEDRVRGGVEPRLERVDGALGRPVHVVGCQPVHRPQFRPEPVGQLLAAEHGHARPPSPVGEQAAVVQDAHVRGRDVDRVDPVLDQPGHEPVGIHPGGGVGHMQLVTGRQGGELAPRGVEGHRGGQRDPQTLVPETFGRRSEDLVPVLGRDVDHARVARDDTLGHPGRSRGVDHVSRVVGRQQDHRITVRQAVQFFRGLRRVQQQGRSTRNLGGGGVREQQRGPCVLGHGRETRSRVLRIERQVGGPRLEHGEHRRDEIVRSGQGEGDHVLRADAARAQCVSEPVRPRVQLPVSQGGAVRDDGHRVGRGTHLCLEELRNRARRHGPAGVAQEVAAFAAGQDVDAADRTVRVPGDRFQQPHPACGQVLDRAVVEQVGGVVDGAVQAEALALRGALLVKADVQVELGGLGRHQQSGGLQPRQPEHRGLVGVEGERDLEQRVAGG